MIRAWSYTYSYNWLLLYVGQIFVKKNYTIFLCDNLFYKTKYEKVFICLFIHFKKEIVDEKK